MRIAVIVFAVAICPLAGALFSFYQPMSSAEYVRMVLVAMACAGASLGLAVVVCARLITAVDAWVRGERGPRLAAEAWSQALRAPARSLRPTMIIAVTVAAIPLTAFIAIEFDYSVGTAGIVLTAILMASLFPTVLIMIGLELILRPIVNETATKAETLAPPTPGLPLRYRLLLIFPLISLISGMFVSVISAGTSDAAFADLGADVIVALVTAGLSTLLIALLVTQALVAPIDELFATIRRYRQGDFAARATVSSSDELGELTTGFNRMADEIQRSREELVSAREEERRRLTRDLHDGVGASLAGIALQLGAARTQLEPGSEADGAIARLEDETREALSDVRVLTRGLRPPALDELGLGEAIRRMATTFTTGAAGAPGPLITVRAEGDLTELPAAVEVAAFYIAREAISNAIRHGHARECAVRIVTNGDLELEVADDGRGLPPTVVPGVGLHSMIERATELGGSCRIAPGPAGGTLVSLQLPLRPPQR